MLYTDGSKHDDGRTGYGFVLFQPADTDSSFYYEHSGHLGIIATVFQAEITAITHAAEHISQLIEAGTHMFNHVVIFTDSKSAIKALEANQYTSQVVYKCAKALDALAQLLPVNISWVKAHVGHQFNEIADQLANTGAKLQVNGPEPYLPVPVCYIKQIIHSSVSKIWKNEWTATTTCRQTKLFISGPNPRISALFLQQERLVYTIACQFITGHCYLRRHEALVCRGQNLDPKCRLCELEDETPWHLLAECPRLNSIRNNIFHQYQFKTGEIPPFHKVLGFIKHSYIYDMLLKPLPAPLPQ